MGSSAKRQAVGLLAAGVALTILIALVGCKRFSPNKDDAKLKEVENIASTVPIHPSFQETWRGSMSKSMLASTGRHYKSPAKYDDVKSFYIEQFQSGGWKLTEERVLKGDRGSRTLTFKKEQYSIVIEYSGEKAVDPDWNYAIDIGWHSGRAW